MTAAKAIRAALIFCVMSLSMRNVAIAQDVGMLLKQQSEGKILVLRHALQGNSQEYDSDGKVRKGGAEGPWTLYGRIKVDEVTFSPSAIVLRGHRVDYKYDSAIRQLVPFPNNIKLTIEISLAQPPKTVTEVNEALHRIFAFDKKDVLDSAPELWRSYLNEHIAPVPVKEQHASDSAKDHPEESPERIQRGDQKFAGGVRRPQPVFTPEPTYPDRASSENFRGIVLLALVVNKDGRVENIRLLRPLGMGTEEAAVAAVQTWRFKPSTRDGKAVAVEMNIEVAFNKY
jgi:TonB family protein